MFSIQISLLVVTVPSLISWDFDIIQTTKEVKAHSRIAPCVNIEPLEIYENGGSTPIFQNHHHIYNPIRFEKHYYPPLLPLLSLAEKLQMLRESAQGVIENFKYELYLKGNGHERSPNLI